MIRKAPEEGKEKGGKKKGEENLPCLALPLEGVRFGAELDGRHGGRAESRSCWSTEAGRVAAEQSTQGTSRARAQAPDHHSLTPEVSHAMGVLPGPELSLSLSLPEAQQQTQPNPTTPAQETTNAGS